MTEMRKTAWELTAIAVLIGGLAVVLYAAIGDSAGGLMVTALTFAISGAFGAFAWLMFLTARGQERRAARRIGGRW
jgi:hypothetical protein